MVWLTIACLAGFIGCFVSFVSFCNCGVFSGLAGIACLGFSPIVLMSQTPSAFIEFNKSLR